MLYISSLLQRKLLANMTIKSILSSYAWMIFRWKNTVKRVMYWSKQYLCPCGTFKSNHNTENKVLSSREQHKLANTKCKSTYSFHEVVKWSFFFSETMMHCLMPKGKTINCPITARRRYRGWSLSTLTAAMTCVPIFPSRIPKFKRTRIVGRRLVYFRYFPGFVYRSATLKWNLF